MQKKLLLGVSFIEGGVLMAYELLASKLYTPVIGSTIYVWTSILIMVLLGLALGYRKGDLIKEEKQKKVLVLTLFVAGGLILLAPIISTFILPKLINLPTQIIALLAGGLLLLPVMFCLGLVSPIIIRLLSKSYSSAGSKSGKVYGISTIGGVLFGMCSVFFGIEVFGVQLVVLLLGAILILLALATKIILKHE